MFYQKPVSTSDHSQFVNITDLVQEALKESRVKSGVITVFVAHTTAGVTINENTDPDVRSDLLKILDEKIPWNNPAYRHAEGNTAAHMKASLMGSSVQIIVDRGRLKLGIWQGVYFCEFDGPRQRQISIKIQAD